MAQVHPEKFSPITRRNSRPGLCMRKGGESTRKAGGSMRKKNEKTRSWHMYSAKSKPLLARFLQTVKTDRHPFRNEVNCSGAFFLRMLLEDKLGKCDLRSELLRWLFCSLFARARYERQQAGQHSLELRTKHRDPEREGGSTTRCRWAT